jgi:hypothetical protein
VLAILALIVVTAGGYWLGRATVGKPTPPDRGYDAGYVAGAGDAFGGFEGGWDHNVPYVIVLNPGTDSGYRVASRVALSPGVNYYLCPDGHTVCQQRR